MLKEERQQQILEILRLEGKVLATELSQKLDVSEDTVRRDLNELAEANLLQRVHGGALSGSPTIANFASRQKQAAVAKAEIAQAAVQFVRDGQVIIMDGGTTTLLVAQHLPGNLQATIITNSPPIALALAAYPNIEICLVGGRLYKDGLVTVGMEAIEAFQSFRADLCLLGICSLHPKIGITASQLDEAQVKRAMIASASQVIALASAEKLGTAGPYVVAPLNKLSHLITERAVPDEVLKPYRELGITIVAA